MEELTISYFREPGKESKRIWGRSEGCTNAEECGRVARGGDERRPGPSVGLLTNER